MDNSMCKQMKFLNYCGYKARDILDMITPKIQALQRVNIKVRIAIPI